MLKKINIFELTIISTESMSNLETVEATIVGIPLVSGGPVGDAAVEYLRADNTKNYEYIQKPYIRPMDN